MQLKFHLLDINFFDGKLVFISFCGHCILSLLSYYLSFGKYDFNVCTILNWKVLRKEMSTHLNISFSAKFMCVHFGGVCGFLYSLSHVLVCLWLYLYVTYLTLEHSVLVLSVDVYSV